jgi:hypothetical protein
VAVIDEARSYVDSDPERYYAAVHEVLDPVVDFRGFARGVMGEYATSARYRSLDEAGRDKLRDQLEQLHRDHARRPGAHLQQGSARFRRLPGGTRRQRASRTRRRARHTAPADLQRLRASPSW